MDMDVRETPDSFVYEINLPGVDEIKVAVENDHRLVIIAVHKKEPEREDVKFIRRERKTGVCKKVHFLEKKANPEGIRGTYKAGVLTIFVEKLPSPMVHKRKTVEVCKILRSEKEASASKSG